MSIYLGDNNITGGFTTEEKKQFNNSINLINEQLDDKVNKTDIIDKTDIVDTLTSTDTDKPLSANQGKVLKTELDKTNESISTVNANLGKLCNKKIYCGEVNGTTVNGLISISNPIGKMGNIIATMKYISPKNPIGYCIIAQSTSANLNFYFRYHRESNGSEEYPPDGTEVGISYIIFY